MFQGPPSLTLAVTTPALVGHPLPLHCVIAGTALMMGLVYLELYTNPCQLPVSQQ